MSKGRQIDETDIYLKLEKINDVLYSLAENASRLERHKIDRMLDLLDEAEVHYIDTYLEIDNMSIKYSNAQKLHSFSRLIKNKMKSYLNNAPDFRCHSDKKEVLLELAPKLCDGCAAWLNSIGKKVQEYEQLNK